MQICHNSQERRYREPIGAATVGCTVTLRLFAPGCSGASVRLWQEGVGETMVPMQQSAALFTAEIKVPEEPCLLWYFFVVNEGGRLVCYGNNPESLGGEGCVYEQGQPPSFQITVYQPFEVPSWYRNGLAYQIFPDRFCRGRDYEERKEAARLPERWKGASRFFEEHWDQVPYYVKDEKGTVTDWQFYGGTLNGIREKIAYLKSLGVTVLYLNPIFQATSNHRYDTGDYKTIDPLLGDNETFRAFAKECLENGIRIILDGVFSHTGADSRYFDKFGNYETAEDPPEEAGAYLNEESKYRSWYRFQNEEPGYECWWGVEDLPNVEETDAGYDRFICGPDGVLEQWLNLGASGFRLDVADELPDSFIQNVNKKLKEESPDNLLIGEVWEDASNKYSYGQLRRYFAGDELDGVMNYPLRAGAIDYCLGKESAALFCRRMRSLFENYPEPAFYGSLNLIGSHDRERILSVLGGFRENEEDLPFENGTFLPKNAALALEGEAYAKAREKLKLLSALQYAMPGVPCVYYGDEAGVQGGKDPDNRRSFPWGREDSELLYHYRMLGLIYHSHSALKDGSFRIFERENCVCILRANEEEAVLTILNPSSESKQISETPKTLLGPDLENRRFVYALELLRSEEIPVGETEWTIPLPAERASVILLKEESPSGLDLKKTAGVLCHLSSLPELSGEGDERESDIHYHSALGKRGRAFVDWLSKTGASLWQMLPLNPVGAGDSPYFSPCVFAGETRFIDRDELTDEKGFETFCRKNSYWLDDWADYVLSEEKRTRTEPEKDREDVLRIYDIKHDQYVFFAQLKALKEYANRKGVFLVGDLAIYASPDGADIKAHPECFQVDENGRPLFVGGVPPDYFSETGQYWSNPLYNWEAMKKDGYEWWYQRLRLWVECFDYVRLDHFRSFSEYFAIPEGKLPKEGFWQRGPGMAFFDCMKKRLPDLPVIAEDLGQLDEGVYNLLKLSGFPGMNIWQFHEEEMRTMNKKEIRNRVFYTGTHDNQTLVGWCAAKWPQENAQEKAKEIIKELLRSDAPWVIFQLQDLLLLDDSARMNIPGTTDSNWRWRCTKPLPDVDLRRNSK